MSVLLKIVMTAWAVIGVLMLQAQQDTLPVINSTAEQQLENLADAEEAETEDDSYLQQYQQLRRHPLNLNTAEEADLTQVLFLSPLQIQQFLQYRQLLGKLISIY